MLIPIKKIHEIGINTDVAQFELPPNAWTDGLNITFDGKSVTKSTQMAKVSPGRHESADRTDAQLISPPYFDDGRDLRFFNAVQVGDDVYFSGIKYIHKMQIGSLYCTRVKSDNLAGIQPTNRPISMCVVGSNVVYCNQTGVRYINQISGADEELTGWKPQWSTKRIVSYANMLLALGTLEEGGIYEKRIRWSNLAKGNAVPADWDAANLSSHAGFNDLQDANGEMLDAVPFGSLLYVYTTDEIYELRYVGAPDIFTFVKLPVKVSALNVGCIQQVPGGHAVVTKDDIVIHNGVEQRSIINNKIKKRLISEIKRGQAESVRLTANYATQELWVVYADEQSADNWKLAEYNKAAVYNWETGTWTFRSLPRQTYVGFLSLPHEKGKVIKEFPNTNTLINNDNKFIDGPGVDFKNNSLVICGQDREMYVLDEGNTTLATSSVPAYVEKVNIDMDESGFAHDSMKMVTGIHPQIQGSGRIYIKVGVQDNPYDPPIWSTPVIFDIKKDYKADFRCTGRYLSVRFESADDQLWSIYGYSIDVKQRGNQK